MIISLKVFLFGLCFLKIVIFVINLIVSGLRVVQCRSVIILVINKSDSRFAVIRFCNHSYEYRRIRLHSVLLPVLIILFTIVLPTADEGKALDRVNDYNTICKSLSLPSDTQTDSADSEFCDVKSWVILTL